MSTKANKKNNSEQKEINEEKMHAKEKHPEKSEDQISAELSSEEKIKKLEEELELNKKTIHDLENQITGLTDKLLRKAAEFENFKRRSESDQINFLKYAAESFIVKLLPAVDDFERTLKHIEDAKDVDSIKEGVKLIYDKFIKLLKDQGVKKIEAVGKTFDVHFHEAVMQRKDNSAAPHTVLEEIETGYLYKDKVIRYSKVIVSDDSAAEPAEASGTENSNIDLNNEAE